ncbi:MAG: lipase [Sandaracinaceae bacterium]|nr:lipase [Sandaracinaceae bacterium]
MSTALLPPVLLVHGIWDTGAELATLRRVIEARGREVDTIDLVPNDGRAPIRALAAQVAERVEVLRARSRSARVDLVGFSMGALVSRTYIQRHGGRETVRRFVSISGPHAGTLDAHVLPFEGARDMRPGSELLRDLASDADPWGEVEVHVLYTPLDLMIVPPRSSELAGARSTTRLALPLHRLMILAPRATRVVADLLSADAAGAAR